MENFITGSKLINHKGLYCILNHPKEQNLKVNLHNYIDFNYNDG